VQSLAPNKNTFVTVLAEISIEPKESVCSRLFDHQPAFPVPTVKRIVTGKAETLVAKMNGFAKQELFNAFSRDGFAWSKLRATLLRALLCLLCPCQSQQL